MATTTLQIDLRHNNVTTETGWNITNTVPSTNKQVFANLLDTTNTASGISMYITSPFTERVSSDTWATEAYHGYPILYWRSSWYATSALTPKIEFRGFNPGQAGTMYVSGFNLNTRNTRYRINGGTGYVYTNKNTLPPNEPIAIPFTANSSGIVELALELILIQMYLNGIKIVYDPDVAATITSISSLVSGQSATVTLSSNSYAATSITLSDALVTKNVPLTGSSGIFNFIAPFPTDSVQMLDVTTVSAIVTDGTTPTAGTSTSYSISSAHPDNATVVPFTAITITDVSDPNNFGDVFSLNPPLKVGTRVVYDSARCNVTSTGILTFNTYTGSSIFYLRDPDDLLCRYLEVVTDAGAIAVAPTMPADTSVSVQAGATTFGTFLASSGTAPITYSLTGTSAGLFNINSSTAIVTFISPAVVGGGSINVVATNSEGSDSQTVSFTVTPVLTGDSDVTLQAGRVEAREQLATVRVKLAYQADSVATNVTDLRTDFNSLISKMNTRGWFTGGEVQTTMLKVAMQNGLIQFLNRIKTQAPNQMDVQSASVAADVAALRTDFNALLTKLKAANLMATS